MAFSKALAKATEAEAGEAVLNVGAEIAAAPEVVVAKKGKGKAKAAAAAAAAADEEVSTVLIRAVGHVEDVGGRSASPRKQVLIHCSVCAFSLYRTMSLPSLRPRPRRRRRSRILTRPRGLPLPTSSSKTTSARSSERRIPSSPTPRS
jgi:hypothetical protein